jgi:hypothetical protein
MSQFPLDERGTWVIDASYVRSTGGSVQDGAYLVEDGFVEWARGQAIAGQTGSCFRRSLKTFFKGEPTVRKQGPGEGFLGGPGVRPWLDRLNCTSGAHVKTFFVRESENRLGWMLNEFFRVFNLGRR